MSREMLKIISGRHKRILRHPDFIARRDQGCEHRLKSYEFKMCKRKARLLVRIPSLGGYPEFSVQLCAPCAKRAEKDWCAELVVGTSITALLAQAKRGATLADVLDAALKVENES